MDETTKALIEKITFTYPTPQPIPSGHLCSIYYDCMQLSPNDLARLAALAVGHLDQHHFDIAVGIAYNGIFFAGAVAGGRHTAILQKDGRFHGPSLTGKRVVVVDDVVHSGNRMNEASAKVTEAKGIVTGFACIIDRSEGRFGTEDKPLWSAFQTNMS